VGARFAASLSSGVELTAIAVGGDAPAAARFIHVGRIKAADRGLELEIRGHFGDRRLRSPLIGGFNAENLAITLGVLLAWQFGVDEALDALGACTAPPGRMEGYRLPNGAVAVVDYAHTPDALAKALAAVRAHARGRVLVVFGCGGERDPGKRALMGEVAERLADRVIVTDDNPRGEDADRIVAMILRGIRRPERVLVERDRARAIDTAIARRRRVTRCWSPARGTRPSRSSGTSAARSATASTLAGRAESPREGPAVGNRGIDRRQPRGARRGVRRRLDRFAHARAAQLSWRCAANASTATPSLPAPRGAEQRRQSSRKPRMRRCRRLSCATRRRPSRRSPAAWRATSRALVLGVGGSNGKTTTKELLAAILSGAGPTLATRGNLNNHIGVPLTLLRLEPAHRYAVVEMGANHPGEIARWRRSRSPRSRW
jgi:hypothetical protein